MAEEQSFSPKVDGFRMKVKLKGKPSEVASALNSVSFLKVAQEKDAVSVAYVESRSIDKSPYLFSLMKFKKGEIEAVYTIPSNSSPTKRKLDVLRYLLNMLTLVEPYYSIDNKVVYQLIEETMMQLEEYTTGDYKKLYREYDVLKREVENLRRSSRIYKAQVKSLSKENYELKNENDELKVRFEKLHGGISDSVLMSRIQEWIAGHSGSINIVEFSRFNKIPEARVEDALNSLVRQGFIEQIQ
jgi:regulator of replication initiation timing